VLAAFRCSVSDYWPHFRITSLARGDTYDVLVQLATHGHGHLAH
jgi:hypothetical protein